MFDDENKCPQCGGSLEMRLGDLECMECGHIVPRKEPRQAERKSSGPGFQQWQQPRTENSGTLAPGQAPAFSDSTRRADIDAGLSGAGGYRAPHQDTEKAILMGIFILIALVGLFTNAQVAGFGQALLSAAIDIGILMLALYVPNNCIKWTCITVTGCSTLLLAAASIALLVAPTALPSGVFTGNATSASVVFVGLVGMLRVALYVWLMTVLYRDIQQQNSY